MSRFQVGDVVIHRDNPSQPEVVREVCAAIRARDCAEIQMIVTSRRGCPRPENQFHNTGMRLVEPKCSGKFGR